MRERSIIHINVADFAVAVERTVDGRLKDRPVIIAIGVAIAVFAVATALGLTKAPDHGGQHGQAAHAEGHEPATQGESSSASPRGDTEQHEGAEHGWSLQSTGRRRYGGLGEAPADRRGVYTLGGPPSATPREVSRSAGGPFR